MWMRTSQICFGATKAAYTPTDILFDVALTFCSTYAAEAGVDKCEQHKCETCTSMTQVNEILRKSTRTAKTSTSIFSPRHHCPAIAQARTSARNACTHLRRVRHGLHPGLRTSVPEVVSRYSAPRASDRWQQGPPPSIATLQPT
jgi:hypothetical protein